MYKFTIISVGWLRRSRQILRLEYRRFKWVQYYHADEVSPRAGSRTSGYP